jgi:hypothetical protein
MPHSEVLIEFTKIGTIIRVNAIDVATGTEIVIQGHASTSQAQLRTVAINKLNYVLKKQQEEKR